MNKILVAFLAMLFIVLTPIGSLADRKKPITIAIIDTGYTKFENGVNLCKQGHADLTQTVPYFNTVPKDKDGHGTNIAHIISDGLKGHELEYCLVIIKYWRSGISGSKAVSNSARAFDLAANIKVDFINYSSFGSDPDANEKKAVLKALNKNIRVITAAGNENSEIVEKEFTTPLTYTDIFFRLNETPKKTTSIYPAMYDKRIMAIGNLDKDGKKAPTSNFGDRVNAWEVGTDINAGGNIMTGTSQATAVHTVKMVLEEIKRRNENVR